MQQCLLLIRGSNERISEPVQTIAEASGLTYEVVEWVRDAELQLQELHPDLVFMRKQATLPLSSGRREVELAQSMADMDAVLPYYDGQPFILATRGEGDAATRWRIPLYAWQEWAGSHMDLSSRVGVPAHASIGPGNVLHMDATLDQQITLRLDYRRRAVPMARDDDAMPSVPDAHHQLIVYWVLVHFYCLTRDGTRELRAKCEERLRAERQRYYNAQLPPITRSFA